VADSALPAEVRQLIARHLATMEQVDVLLLLARSPEQWRSEEEIRTALRIDETGVSARTFDELRAAGLIESDGSQPARYHYAATNERDKAAVALLALAYNAQPVTLVRAIYARPTPAQSFADAFRLRKKADE
jgi:DNA-binding MarR family transcriptional regulator